MKSSIDQIKQAEIEAEIFLKYARALSKASTSDDDAQKLLALDNNLRLWVEIETSLKDAKNLLSQEIKENLMQLSKFVERMTLSKGVKMSKTDFDCLVNINMQISEGLLEAVKNSLAREEAFSYLNVQLISLLLVKIMMQKSWLVLWIITSSCGYILKPWPVLRGTNCLRKLSLI